MQIVVRGLCIGTCLAAGRRTRLKLFQAAMLGNQGWRCSAAAVAAAVGSEEHLAGV